MSRTLAASAPNPMSIAVKLLQLGRFAEAEPLFRATVSARPGNVSAVAGLATVLKATARAAQARDLLHDALRAVPGNTVLLGTLGTVLEDLGEEARAAATFRSTLVINPALLPALNNLALIWNRTGNPAEAVQLWTRALMIASGFQEARLNLLTCLFWRGDDAAAALHATAALRRDPINPTAWLYRARARRRQGDALGAVSGLKSALAANPAAADLWFELGEAGPDLVRPDRKTVRACERCVCCAPGDARAHYNLGVVRGRLREHAAAAVAYRRAIEIRPDFAEARSNLATTLVADRRFDAAIPLLEAVVRDNPADNGAAVALASQLRRRDQVERAAQLLAGVLARAPSHPGALLEMSHVEAARGRSGRSLEMAIEAGVAAPHLAEVQRRLADLYRDRKAYDLAIRHYDNVLTLVPRSTEVFCHRYHTALERSFGDLAAAPAEPWRADMTRAVFAAPIPCPKGFDSVPAFNAAAVEFGGRHPSLQWEPGDKTTRNGAQTAPTLLAGAETGVPAVLRRTVMQRVDAYLGHLHDRGINFLEAMRPPELRINMWCVFLDPGGHQLTHHHPAGWISGVYYLEIPDSVTAEAGTDGCIEFGRPHGHDYPQADRHPTLTVRPEPGMMVLFPSGLYHRTFPFRSGRRVCLAFDVVDRSVEYHD